MLTPRCRNPGLNHNSASAISPYPIYVDWLWDHFQSGEAQLKQLNRRFLILISTAADNIHLGNKSNIKIQQYKIIRILYVCAPSTYAIFARFKGDRRVRGACNSFFNVTSSFPYMVNGEIPLLLTMEMFSRSEYKPGLITD